MANPKSFWANRPFPLRKALWGGALLVLGFVFSWALRFRPELVETFYSRGFYPWVIGVLTTVSRRIPFSLAETGLLVGLVLLLWQVGAKFLSWKRGDRSLGNIFAGVLGCGLLGLGLGFVLFLGLWGLNYSRQPLAASLEYPSGEIEAREVTALRAELLATARQVRSDMEEDSQGVAVWKHGSARMFEEATRAMKSLAAKSPWGFPLEPSSKLPWISPWMTALGITGIYCPFTGESHGNAEIPDLEKAFIFCHEIAHAYGIAREDEANFLAALACREHDLPFFRYAGAFNALYYVGMPLLAKDPALAGLQRDLAKVDRFWKIVRDRDFGFLSGKMVLEIGRQANDAYLKSQWQKDGTRSYGRMVDLLVLERRIRTR